MNHAAFAQFRIFLSCQDPREDRCQAAHAVPVGIQPPSKIPIGLSKPSFYRNSTGSSAVGQTYRNRQRRGNGSCITGRVGRFRFCRPQYPPPKTRNLLRFRRSSAGMAGVVRSWSISIRPYRQPPIRVACHQHRSVAGIGARTSIVCTVHSRRSTNRWKSWRGVQQYADDTQAYRHCKASEATETVRRLQSTLSEFRKSKTGCHLID